MFQYINEYTEFPFSKLLDNILSNNIKNTISIKRIFFNANDNNISTHIVNTDFIFELKRNRFTNSKSAIIICSKDNQNILKYSLSKIRTYNIDQEYDILLIDDRSSSEAILNLSDEFNTSYLRIDNSDNIFNYSVINNIGVSYLKYYGKNTIIFYNNDMWPSNETTFSNIIDKHNSLNSDLTGCKLIYPIEKEYLSIGKPQHLLGEHIHKIYNTVQHGGIFFTTRPSLIFKSNNNQQFIYVPSHLWRFYDYNHAMASFDTRCCAVTGALHIIDIDKFIKVGGLNQSMSSTFQDIDLCMKLLDNNMSINYIGSEYMYHGESITICKDRTHISSQMISDNILWEYLWGGKIPNLIGLEAQI